jgi:hypothetical protein
VPDLKATQPAKRWFGMKPWVLLVLLSVLAVGSLLFWGNSITVVTTVVAGAGTKEQLLPFTTNLTDLDRIEIESIESNFNGQVTKILDSKVLDGEKANAFTKLWREQNYVFGEYAMCREPGLQAIALSTIFW